MLIFFKFGGFCDEDGRNDGDGLMTLEKSFFQIFWNVDNYCEVRGIMNEFRMKEKGIEISILLKKKGF